VQPAGLPVLLEMEENIAVRMTRWEILHGVACQGTMFQNENVPREWSCIPGVLVR